MTVGDRIRLKRIERKMTQKEMARLLNKKHQTSISKIETNERNLTLSDLSKVATILDTSIDYLLGREEEKNEEIAEFFHEFNFKENAEINAIATLLNEENRKNAVNYLKFLYQSQIKEEERASEKDGSNLD